MVRVVCFSLIILFLCVVTGTAYAACPPNSSASYEAGNIVHCKCNAGYENRAGACRPIPAMLAKPDAAMRPISRTQCLKFQEDIRRDGLIGCKSNLYYCMIENAAGFPAAWCTVGLAIAGFSLNAAGVAGAIANCGEKAQTTYALCEPKLTACTEAVTASYPKGIASCPSK